jgi:RimJ/RimL family protein N-acetyltransferase
MIPTLETPRLWLVPQSLDDVAQIQALFPRWEIVRALAAAVPWPYPADGALTWTRDVVLPAMARGESWHWTLRLKSLPDQIIGAISLTAEGQSNRGFWMGLPWQGQGLMSEAAEAVTDFWFQVLGFPVLRVPKAAANAASRRISERQGMRVISADEGDFVGGRAAAETWEITAEEWRARAASARPRPSTLPRPHREFLRRSESVLRADPRFVGVAAGGSYLANQMDEFSDLDLVLAIEPAACDEVMAGRRAIAESLGTLLASFTGEHVGEPRLLVCLYGDPLLHVDLKFVALADVAHRVEDPAVLWERDGRLSAALAAGRAAFPRPDWQWIDDRFWTWVHYLGGKIARGELFEALDGLAFLRGRVLGPLALERAGARPSGVRRIEGATPDAARTLQAAVARYDAADCFRALRACIDQYCDLRPSTVDIAASGAAETAARQYLDEMTARYDSHHPPATTTPSAR